MDQFARCRLVPVVVLDSADAAAPLAEALVGGGLAVAEVTFRTEAAERFIFRLIRCPSRPIPGVRLGNMRFPS